MGACLPGGGTAGRGGSCLRAGFCGHNAGHVQLLVRQALTTSLVSPPWRAPVPPLLQ